MREDFYKVIEALEAFEVFDGDYAIASEYLEVSQATCGELITRGLRLVIRTALVFAGNYEGAADYLSLKKKSFLRLLDWAMVCPAISEAIRSEARRCLPLDPDQWEETKVAAQKALRKLQRANWDGCF